MSMKICILFAWVGILIRGVRGSVGVVFFFQIYYRTDKDRFFHNWNRRTPLESVFRPIAVRFFAVGLVSLVGLKY